MIALLLFTLASPLWLAPLLAIALWGFIVVCRALSATLDLIGLKTVQEKLK